MAVTSAQRTSTLCLQESPSEFLKEAKQLHYNLELRGCGSLKLFSIRVQMWPDIHLTSAWSEESSNRTLDIADCEKSWRSKHARSDM